MTTPTKKRSNYVQVDQNVWRVVLYLLAAHALDGIRDATGWQWMVAISTPIRIMAVIYGVYWLVSRVAEKYR